MTTNGLNLLASNLKITSQEEFNLNQIIISNNIVKEIILLLEGYKKGNVDVESKLLKELTKNIQFDSSLRKELINLVTSNRLSDALEILQNHYKSKNEVLENIAIINLSKLNYIEMEKLKGTITHDQHKLDISQIRNVILELLKLS